MFVRCAKSQRLLCLGQTEWIRGSLNPDFCKPLMIPTSLGSHVSLEFRVYDVRGKVLKGKDIMGSTKVLHTVCEHTVCVVGVSAVPSSCCY